MNKKLCLLFCGFLVVVITVAVVLRLTLSKKSKDLDESNGEKQKQGSDTEWSRYDYTVCDSPTCIESAMKIKYFMDSSKSPCNDFYGFACGGFEEKTELLESEEVKSRFFTAHTNLKKILKALLENYTTTEGDDNARNKAALLYESCKLSEPEQEVASHKLLVNVLSTVMGGWPLVERYWDEDNFDWSENLANIIKHLDPNFLLQIRFLPDPENYQKYMIAIVPSFFSSENNTPMKNSVQDDDQLNSITRLKIKLLLFNIATAIDITSFLNPNFAEDLNILTDLVLRIQFSTKNTQKVIKNYQRGPEDNIDYFAAVPLERNFFLKAPERTVFSVSELKKLWPQIQIFFKIVFADTGVQVNDSTRIMTDITGLKAFLKLMTVSTQRINALFWGWKLVEKWGPILSTEITELLSDTSRDDMCTTFVNDAMGFAVGRLHLDKYFPNSERKEVKKMVEQLRLAFKESLNDNKWMDKTTRDNALKKINNMVNSVGAPDWVYDDSKLNEYYSQISSLSSTDFARNFQKVRRAIFKTNAVRLTSKVDRKNDWITSKSATVNAFYSNRVNGMIYPSGIISPPFYESGQHRALNLGSLGTIAGHEITHGFDDKGSQRNEYGGLQNWWTKNSYDKFVQMQSCFVKQYNSIIEEMTGSRINGTRTLGENIADNGGLRCAFKAYRNDKNKKDVRLKYLEEYSEDQLFFIAAAQTWCTKSSPENMEMQMLDNHSPNKYRAIVPFQNFEEFSKAFSCPKNSEMNPNVKCHVW